MSHSLIKLIRERNKIRRQWQRSGDTTLKNIVNTLNRKIHKESFESQNEKFSNKIENMKPGSQEFWKVTKYVKSKSNIIPPLRDKVTNDLILNDLDKSNAIAAEFSKSHTITHTHSDVLTINQVRDSINRLNEPQQIMDFTLKTTPNELINLIQQLKKRKAPGSDLVTNQAVKNIPKKCIVLLNNIINKSLQ